MPALPRSRRLTVIAALAAAGLALTLVAQDGGRPASAAAPGDRVVVSGDARFEVLSPTLIRTEYAGDGDFTDEATFNAIGRDGFEPVDYTSSVVDGWLTIDTGSAVLRYRVGSGSFGSDNLTVDLTTTAGQRVSAAPWQQPAAASCSVGVLCEAEDLDLSGLGVATNHAGFTGRGFAAGYEKVGDTLSFEVDVAEAGAASELVLRYANSQGGDAQITTRTLSVAVDGGAARTISLPPTANWDDWALARLAVGLAAGTHTITVSRASGDSGSVNVDSLALGATGATYPGVAPATGADCAFGAVCEGESSTLAGGASSASDHNGHSGAGFTAGLGRGASQTTHVTDVPAAGTYALQVRYANGQPTTRDIAVATATGTASATLDRTSGWDYWATATVPVTLPAGDSDVTISCPDAASCGVNVDTVAVVDAASPVLAPHAALGGYRRDLDTANGTVPTNPGLLYQDGWSLLDDTTSDLLDGGVEKLVPRGDHGGEGYQDGYVFAYGTDYTQGLADLATLTGPTKLLPRWAYGVWYSEYYDRTSADFEDTIVPRFAAEGVPLDVLAVDTDYKAPDKWNGWEVDESRFPDMAGFLARLEAKGIHNTLNVHPSIQNDDPRFAETQATANGNLIADGSKYLFDWSDPAQLEAYFDLHTDLESEGVDVWWLDWCCSDASRYTKPGVTPDAFINQQYATRADDRIGRGFAFSRAYGALTAGGYGNPQSVPNGPWADKRTTLHFTGDTVSSWAMLQAQVGYTPGESSSTGLSAVSHDIGGHTGGQTFPGAEPESTKLADDLYARWVQFGTFQPIDRLHSNHSDRLPWQYGEAANASAKAFLNLRENLMPLSYTLAEEATRTGVPVTRPLYLQYPEQAQAYSLAGSEYLYGSDVLVAPVTTPGTTATTSVWFPAGSDWTDYFTGTTYAGGTTADVTTGLDTMPVFVRAGGIVPTRTSDVANDAAGPVTDLTLTTATGADGSFSLYEDDGVSAYPAPSAVTPVTYTERPDGGALVVGPADGSYPGAAERRAYTTVFTDVDRPQSVTVDGVAIAASAWSYDEEARKATVSVPARPVSQATTVAFSTTAVTVPGDPGAGDPGAGTPGAGVPGAGAPGTPGEAAGPGTGAGNGSAAGSTSPLAFTGSAGVGVGLAAGLLLLVLGATMLVRRRRASRG
ncbi:TIM-barrel domain-containing protein [Frigoribacterium sp. 2-23]|uniref:TIM-barrel domain-containing protein n=1 Tax=Frigoribacterium sp. 2-23 TaxID=3415006 RepID=UPI003C6ED7FB